MVAGSPPAGTALAPPLRTTNPHTRGSKKPAESPRVGFGAQPRPDRPPRKTTGSTPAGAAPIQTILSALESHQVGPDPEGPGSWALPRSSKASPPVRNRRPSAGLATARFSASPYPAGDSAEMPSNRNQIKTSWCETFWSIVGIHYTTECGAPTTIPGAAPDSGKKVKIW